MVKKHYCNFCDEFKEREEFVEGCLCKGRSKNLCSKCFKKAFKFAKNTDSEEVKK